MIFWILLFVVVYFAVKAVANSQRKSELHLAKSSVQRCRICPECAEDIKVEAKKCRYCGCSLQPCSEEERLQIEKTYTDELRRHESGSSEAIVDAKYKNENAWK